LPMFMLGAYCLSAYTLGRRHTFITGSGNTLSKLHFLTILVEPRLIYLISYIHAKGEDLRFPSATECKCPHFPSTPDKISCSLSSPSESIPRPWKNRWCNASFAETLLVASSLSSLEHKSRASSIASICALASSREGLARGGV
jgi:hypothetical protein